MCPDQSNGKLPGWVIPTAVGGVVLLFVIILASMGIGYSNREIDLRTAIEAKVKDNESEFDNMFKKISQVAQVSEAQKQAIIELIAGHAEARGGIKGGGFINALHESVPNQTMDQYKQLSTIIVASRDRWTMRQKELIDLSRAHERLRRRFPSSIFVGGRESIAITVVTSVRAKEAMATGVDDNISVFGK